MACCLEIEFQDKLKCVFVDAKMLGFSKYTEQLLCLVCTILKKKVLFTLNLLEWKFCKC